MNMAVPSKSKKKARLPAKVIPEPAATPIIRDASVLFFPINVLRPVLSPLI